MTKRKISATLKKGLKAAAVTAAALAIGALGKKYWDVHLGPDADLYVGGTWPFHKAPHHTAEARAQHALNRELLSMPDWLTTRGATRMTDATEWGPWVSNTSKPSGGGLMGGGGVARRQKHLGTKHEEIIADLGVPAAVARSPEFDGLLTNLEADIKKMPKPLKDKVAGLGGYFLNHARSAKKRLPAASKMFGAALLVAALIAAGPNMGKTLAKNISAAQRRHGAQFNQQVAPLVAALAPTQRIYHFAPLPYKNYSEYSKHIRENNPGRGEIALQESELAYILENESGLPDDDDLDPSGVGVYNGGCATCPLSGRGIVDSIKKALPTRAQLGKIALTVGVPVAALAAHYFLQNKVEPKDIAWYSKSFQKQIAPYLTGAKPLPQLPVRKMALPTGIVRPDGGSAMGVLASNAKRVNGRGLWSSTQNVLSNANMLRTAAEAANILASNAERQQGKGIKNRRKAIRGKGIVDNIKKMLPSRATIGKAARIAGVAAAAVGAALLLKGAVDTDREQFSATFLRQMDPFLNGKVKIPEAAKEAARAISLPVRRGVSNLAASASDAAASADMLNVSKSLNRVAKATRPGMAEEAMHAGRRLLNKGKRVFSSVLEGDDDF